jgi:hypothetical protein
MHIQFVERGRLKRGQKIRQLATGLVVAFLCSGLLVETAHAEEAPKVVVKTVNPAPPTTAWGGLGWGIGIATDFDMTGRRVATADIVNNVVRIKDTSNNVGVSFVLEAHYFLRDYRFGFGRAGICDPLDYLNCTELGHGPFVAIEVGDGSSATPAANGPITAFAMGWMVGMRHPSNLVGGSQTASWNFGLGLRVTPKSQVLGDGIIANQPLPAGETIIRYKTEPRFGVMLLSSFSF